MTKRKKIEYEEIFKIQRGIGIYHLNKKIKEFSLQNPAYKIFSISLSQRAPIKLVCNIIWVKKDYESDIL